MRQAIDETYEDVELLLFKLSRQAVARYGGEFDEYLSAAGEAFVDAYVAYNPSKGAFTTWLYWQMVKIVQRGFQEGKPKKSGARMIRGLDMFSICQKTRFDLEQFLADLSDDARAVVRILIHSDIKTKGGLKKKLRSVGWAWSQIIESFEEIREALECN